MSDERDELSPLSRSVLSKARAEDPSPEAIEALRRALAPQLGGGGGGGSPPVRTSARLWVSAAVATTLALLIGLAAWPETRVAPTPTAPPIEAPPAVPEVVVPPTPAPTQALVPEVVPEPTPRTAITPDEPAYIDSVRRALDTQPQRALRLAQRHHARFPEGLLGEEAEVLEIEALARMGQRAEAEARASSFYAQHATSPYRRRIDRALATP